jgi:hypothetical protein
MFGAVAEFTSTRQGDSTEFMEKVRALAIGVACDREQHGYTSSELITGLGLNGCTFPERRLVSSVFIRGACTCRLLFRTA